MSPSADDGRGSTRPCSPRNSRSPKRMPTSARHHLAHRSVLGGRGAHQVAHADPCAFAGGKVGGTECGVLDVATAHHEPRRELAEIEALVIESSRWKHRAPQILALVL